MLPFYINHRHYELKHSSSRRNKYDTHQPENYKRLQFRYQALHGRFAQYREYFRYYQQALHLSKAVRHLQSLYLLRKTGDRM